MHPSRGDAQPCSGLGLKNGHDVRGHRIGFVLGALFRREGALVALLCQFTDAGLGFLISAHANQLARRTWSEASDNWIEQLVQHVRKSSCFLHVCLVSVRVWLTLPAAS